MTHINVLIIISIQYNLCQIQLFQKYQYLKMINFSQLFTCPQTQIYEKIKTQKKYLQTTTISSLIDPQGDLLLMMGSICYGITKQTKATYFLYENNNASFMILDLENHLHGNYELLVKQNCDMLIACLAEKCNVTGKQKQVKKQQFLVPKGLVQPKQKQEQNEFKKEELQIGLPLQQNDGTYVQMSKSVGKGMYMIGKLLSKGITAVGGYVANNIEPSKQIKFSQSTKQNLKQASELTNQVFQFASGSVKKLIGYGRQVALDAASQNSEANDAQKKNLSNDLKNGAVTGIKVFINLYDGIIQGTDQVMNGTFKAGGQIVKKKYGVEAEQVLTHVAGGVDNVVKIYKLPKASVKYLFKVEKQQSK